MSGNSKADWGKADWARRDVEIAEEFGVSRQRVFQARRKFGGGVEPSLKRRRRGVTAAQRIAAMETSGRTADEVARAAGCGKGYAGARLRKLRKDYRRLPKGGARYDWSLMPSDWRSRTDKEMAELVGASSPAVVTQWRIRHGMRKRGQ